MDGYASAARAMMDAMDATERAAQAALAAAERFEPMPIPQAVYPTSNPSQRRGQWGSQAKHGKVKRGRRGGR
jgi:hypothetical protein